MICGAHWRRKPCTSSLVSFRRRKYPHLARKAGYLTSLPTQPSFFFSKIELLPCAVICFVRWLENINLEIPYTFFLKIKNLTSYNIFCFRNTTISHFPSIKRLTFSLFVCQWNCVAFPGQ